MKRAPLKVAMVSVGWPGRPEVGGAARHGFRLAQELASLVDLTVITRNGGDKVLGSKMIYLDVPETRFSHYYKFPLAVRKLLKTEKFDLIYALGDDWAIPRSETVVRVFHGSSKTEARHSTLLRKLNHWVLFALEKYSQTKARARIAVGPESQVAFKAHFLIPPVNRFGAMPTRTPSENPKVVFIGSWYGRKMGSLAWDVFDQATRDLSETALLVVIGQEEDKENWPTDPRIKFESTLTDSQVMAELATCWCLLSTSNYEGFGIPAFEAALLGVVSINTPTPGSEFLKEALGGSDLFIVEEKKFLVAALEKVLKLHGYIEPTKRDLLQLKAQKLLEKADPEFLVSKIFMPLVSDKTSPTEDGWS